MKICMLAPEFLPIWGGVGTYIVELVRHLPKNVEVHIVAPMRRNFGNEKLSTSDYSLATYFPNNVHIHFVCNATDTFFYNANFQYKCFKYVPKLVKEEKIDIIHSHTAHMPDLLLQFRNLKIPFLTTIHTTIQGQREGTKSSKIGFSGLEFSEKITYLTYPFLRLAEKVYFSRKRYYLTVSEWMKQQILKQYPKIQGSPICVIHNSVDTKRFSPVNIQLPQRDIILFTGRMIAAKGLGYLVEAIPSILEEHPNTLFLFIGAGNYLPYQRRLKERGILKKNYKFLGYVKEESDMVNYYRMASIYVAPTLYENLPIRILEAMACGIPVVASNLCAIPEAIDNGVNGLLIKPGSIPELIEAINSLLEDIKFRKKIGDNARKTALEKFDWNLNIFRTVNLYKQILDSYNKI